MAEKRKGHKSAILAALFYLGLVVGYLLLNWEFFNQDPRYVFGFALCLSVVVWGLTIFTSAVVYAKWKKTEDEIK